ncbi:uncharacterized protein DUF4232 [Tamaricihabitans halophyticus]|uniref:Uncharacterized protein DUF4232 n=1 Tax=Tamaricihabitans halophyticus TaxID=1262583 RepID=A0A4R2QQS5_9PSEU|nr:DUF4232 domain-containing protein [Tamaricihabitans halophyticus]TCP52100.1 uncharacterized protein DUF4232 [Tamaricihabitans halophyticus]
MYQKIRRSAWLSAVGLLVAGLVTGTAGPASAGQDVPACAAADLSVAKGESQAGMGQRGLDILVSNSMREPCAVRGYPKIQLLDDNRERVHTEETYGSTYFAPDSGEHQIVLKPGESARSNIGYAHPTAPDEPQVTASHLQVTVPGTTDGAFVLPIHKTQVYQAKVTATALST